MGYCFRRGVWVFLISEEAAAKLFQPEKDPGEQVQAFSFLRNLTWRAPSAPHFQALTVLPG